MRFKSCWKDNLFLSILFFHFLSGQLFLVLYLPLLLQYFPIKCFSHSEYCLFSSFPGLEVMSRPLGKAICWRQSAPSGQTGFWLVVQEFVRFFFRYSRWTCGSTAPPDSYTHFLSFFLGRWFIRCLCWDLDLKVIDEYALQHSTVYIYSPGNMPDVQLTVVLLIQKPLLIELWNCFLDAVCWNLWDSLFIGDDYLQRTLLAAK